MTGYSLITTDEIAAFEAAIRDEGLKTHDFELQEEVFDPQTAEVEARKDRVARISGRTQWSSPRLRSGDADRLRAPQLQHAVQDHDADGHLGGLTLVRARVQPVADHPFEAADRGLR